jgi:integrase
MTTPARITTELLEATKVEKGAPRIEWKDPACKGLQIRISAGAKSFAFVYKRHGKLSRVTLGHFPTMSITKARKAADKQRVAVSDGRDVRQEKRAAVAAVVAGQLTFRELSDAFIEAVKQTGSSQFKRSWRADERHLDHFCDGWEKRLSTWGRRAASNVGRSEIHDALAKIAKEAPVSANRHYATLHRLFRWAASVGKWPKGESSPMQGMEKPTDESDRERERALSTAELRKVWAELTSAESEIGPVTRDALRLILLTAQRPGEVAGMALAELSLSKDSNTWTIPKARAKNKIGQHVVPLTAPALSIVKVQLEGRENPLAVFESRTFGDRPMSRHTLPHACADIATKLKLEHFTAHDLRRTAASLMRAFGVAPYTIDDVLGHVPPKLVRTYQAHDPIPARREALEILAAGITKAVASKTNSSCEDKA